MARELSLLSVLAQVYSNLKILRGTVFKNVTKFKHNVWEGHNYTQNKCERTTNSFHFYLSYRVLFKNVIVAIINEAVVMERSSFWDMKPCSPLKGNGRSGGKYRLHLQHRGIKQAKKRA
jgi:hypothetical protein